LMIVGVIVALLSAESRRDGAILVAIGAGPRSRRSVAGASAALIGVLSAVFAVVVGLAPTMVLLHVENHHYPFEVPWAVIAGVVLGVPAIAGLSAALVSRQPKAALLLRPIA
ncbi:MAG: FtsX-like permease family protein, partial [Actinomycetota bacterium]